MNIIVHYPKSAELSAELEKRVATVHIEAVTTHINSLSCPKSLKLRVISEMLKSMRIIPEFKDHKL